MRTVIIGEPNKLKRVRLHDLPADKNLDDSFWRYVDLSRLDLRAYSMTNCDVINYKATRTKFPSCHYSQFRFPVDNTGITIPTDVSSYNHDLVAEVFRQATNTSDPIIQRVYAYLVSGYDVSWKDGLHHLLKIATPAEVLDAMNTACQGYPSLQSRLQRHFDSRDWGSDLPAALRDLQDVRFYSQKKDKSINILGQFGFAQFDRWALGEALTQHVQQRLSDPDVKIHVAQIHPYPFIVTGGDEEAGPDWWKGRTAR